MAILTSEQEVFHWGKLHNRKKKNKPVYLDLDLEVAFPALSLNHSAVLYDLDLEVAFPALSLNDSVI